jgi:hypothetical protein
MSPGSAKALPGDADMALDDAGTLAALMRHHGWWPAIMLGAWRGAVAVAALVIAQMRRAPSRFHYRMHGHSAGASVAPMHRCGWPPTVAIVLWWWRSCTDLTSHASARRRGIPQCRGRLGGVSGTPGSSWSPCAIMVAVALVVCMCQSGAVCFCAVPGMGGTVGHPSRRCGGMVSLLCRSGMPLRPRWWLWHMCAGSTSRAYARRWGTPSLGGLQGAQLAPPVHHGRRVQSRPLVAGRACELSKWCRVLVCNARAPG